MNRYISKPYHVITVCVPLLALGTLGFLNDGWFWFGVGMYLFSVGTFTMIVIIGIQQTYNERWDYWTSFAKEMRLSKDPQLYQAFGFIEPPNEVTFVVDKTDHEDRKHGVLNQSRRKLPVSSAKFLTFCEAVLSGQPMSESKWTGNGKLFAYDEFKRLMAFLTDKDIKWAVSNHPTNYRMGYSLTRAGRDEFEKYVKETHFRLPDTTAPFNPALPS